MSEIWKPTRVEVTYEVDLDPPADYLVRTKGGGRRRPAEVQTPRTEYPVQRVIITYDRADGAWKPPFVLLRTVERDEHAGLGQLHLDQLRERPPWLTDILAAADALRETEVWA